MQHGEERRRKCLPERKYPLSASHSQKSISQNLITPIKKLPKTHQPKQACFFV